MFVPYILLPALTGAVIGAAVGCFIPRIAEKTISYKRRQRGEPEPQSPIPKWVKLLCILIMTIMTALLVAAGSSLLGGIFRYKAFFVIAFIVIAMVIFPDRLLHTSNPKRKHSLTLWSWHYLSAFVRRPVRLTECLACIGACDPDFRRQLCGIFPC